MQTIILGKSGLAVSRLAYGTGRLGGGMGLFAEEAGIAAVRRSLDHGINLFDTGRIYGRAEELLNKSLGAELRRDRDSIVLASKAGLRTAGADNPYLPGISRDGRPQAIRDDLEASLRTLGVDHIDIYQLHYPDPKVPLAESAAALAALRDEGKVRHIGVSNFTAAELAEFSTAAEVETLQPVYSMLYRSPAEDELPYAAAHDIGVMVYGPLAHGLLAGSAFDPKQGHDEEDWRRKHGLFEPGTRERNGHVVAALERFALDRGYSIAQLAIAWLLVQPAVHVAIVGTVNGAHLDALVPGVDIGLSREDVVEIETILADAVAVPFFAPEQL